MREKEKKKERDKDKDQAKEKEKEREKKKHKLVNEIKRENGEVKLLQKGESQTSECAHSKGGYTWAINLRQSHLCLHEGAVRRLHT